MTLIRDIACAALLALAIGAAGAVSAMPRRPVAPLRVTANHGPAKVYLDSLDLGLTPLEIPQADTMTHRLRIEAPGFRAWTEPVKFDPRAARTIDAALQRREGILVIATDPAGAALTINGIAAGRAPLTLERQPVGTYELAAELPGHHPVTASIVVDGERICHWTPVLGRKLGRIAFGGWPPQAEISWRRRVIGTVPMVWDSLKHGRYAFEFSRPGFEPAMVQATVTSDSLLTVAADLRPTSAWKALGRSLLIPGSGQHYRGSPRKGLLFKGLWFVTAATIAAVFNDRETRYARYRESVDRYRSASDSFDQRYQDVLHAYDVARNANRRTNNVLAVAATIYTVNLADAVLFAPNRDQFQPRRGPQHGR
ncbi:MAG: PEGA domain-containing protein [Candidatus Edwardsbacteria bacterium]|jgi:hypothetical protein|nr:PEGA domain-containing protein [Candidatus Edwardsbacteria bacterium]